MGTRSRSSWLERLQRVNIQAKLLIPFLLLSVGPAALVGLVSILVARQALTNRIHKQLAVRGDHLAIRAEMFLDGVKADLRFLLTLSSVRDLASIDRREDDMAWKRQRKRVEEEFFVFSSGRRAYYQTRYLDPVGREIVRLNCKNGSPDSVPLDQLQDKSDRYYFVEAAKLPPGGVFVSSLDLNEEHGRIEVPHRPVLRYAAPVHAAERLVGVIVINIYADYFAELLRTPGGDYEVTLLDADGTYLLYAGSSKDKAAHRIFGTGARIQDELYGGRADTSGPTSEPVRLRNGERASLSRIRLGDKGYERRLILMLSVGDEPVVDSTKSTTKAIILIISLVTIASTCFGIFVARYLVKPIRALKRGVDSAATGDFNHPIEVRTGDEIEDLAAHFESMRAKLGDSQQRLSRWNEELQKAVAEKTEELRNSEQRERLERQKIESMVGTIGAELLLIERDMTVSWASQELIRRIGGPQAVLGRKCHDVLWGAQGLCGDCAVNEVLRDGHPRKSIVMRPDERGAERYYQIAATPVLDGSPEPGRVLELRVDITESVLRERETRAHLARADKFASLGQLAAGVVHEVANPLAAMKTSIQVMKERQQCAPGQEVFLDRVVREIDRLSGFLSTFSSFARPRKPAFSDVSPGEIVEGVAQLLQKQAEKKEARIVIEPASVSCRIRADSGQVQQVVLNLVLNALDAVSSGGCVRVGWGPHGIGTRLFVSDDGDGIPPENLEKIFDPFFTTKPSGTGLGLAIARQIMQEHGGSVQVESAPGSGSTFTLLFPPRERRE
ncbi:MAG: HAMP domain-containing protein [Planctomycetes bacterium]|nr:HAMP domain-containing protein [Planctomycetota bacterium]